MMEVGSRVVSAQLCKSLTSASIPGAKSQVFILIFSLFALLLQITCAQSQGASTDPSEVAALKSLIKDWSKPAWTMMSDDPCIPPWQDADGFGLLRCDCSYNNNSTCHVTSLFFESKQIAGVLSEDIGAFSHLITLLLNKNSFTGPLPTSIGNLTNLQKLDLSDNNFSGTLPKELGSLTELLYLWPNMNNFNGPLPTSIGNLTKLQSLIIDYNSFSGTIPKELGSLTELQSLHLCPNNFTGTLPPELGNLVNLQTMWIVSCVDLGGEIPFTFASLVNITTLWIAENSFTGKIPDFTGNWTKLSELLLNQNSFTGPLPTSIGNLTNLQSLDISDNAFSENIPKELGSLTELQYLLLNKNSFTGLLPTSIGNLTKLQKLDISHNGFSGTIPNELGSLTELQYLWPYMNSFTGPLPTSIGNLTKLQSLAINYNAFSGNIPKEFGSLTELQLLYLCPNNFSGTLPPELGNLVNLQTMWIVSCVDLSGEIPSTFESLVNITSLRITGSSFTGKIPDSIGNWTKLSELRIEGNSFEGPIPSSFANLVSLTSLRISEVYNVSSSLDFVQNMVNLTALIVRNAMISGSIPDAIGKLQSLKFLDLSFNQLTGEVPDDLFFMSSLNYLFLGNNNLSGRIPSFSKDDRKFIDLSYNKLSGELPEWLLASLQSQQGNILGNNFVFTNQNISASQGQHCLQRTFTCKTSTPQTRLSIDCGGSAAIGNNGTVKYEADYHVLGGASYFLDGIQTWAVSDSGVFVENETATYLEHTNERILNTDMQELFQTSRTSAGSLRYYCWGLDNGPYTVNLMFAETSIPDPSTKSYLSLQRRMFDIYIQGRLQVKDFDIAKEAGGVNRAIVKKLSVNVTENYLEIHLFSAGKGTGFIHGQPILGPSIAGLDVVSDHFKDTLSKPKSKRTRVVVGISVATSLACFVLIMSLILYIRLKKFHVDEDKDLIGIAPTFSYSELKDATDDFSNANKLGQGGFGPVYKGLLCDNRHVAVKQLSVESHQGKSEFLTEIAIISDVRHQNLVKLYGCCIEKNRPLLVYEYLENSSLDRALFGGDLHLDWPSRFKVCLGTAKGLAYLHEELTPRIIHRDIKAANILLDAELCPKISDFGLAKLFHDKATHISTKVAGTPGYLAPEYAMLGKLTQKADIFGFGVLTLEIVSGRPNTINTQDNEKYLLELAWNLYENGRCLDLVDPKLREFDEEETMRLVTVALWCTQTSPAMRPPMSRVVAMLLGDLEVNPVTSKPSYWTDMAYNEELTSSILSSEVPSTSLLVGR